jgi:hypothetical protein
LPHHRLEHPIAAASHRGGMKFPRRDGRREQIELILASKPSHHNCAIVIPAAGEKSAARKGDVSCVCP